MQRGAKKIFAVDVGHGQDFFRATLQQAVGETAGGRAEVNGGQAGDGELKMFQRVFELVPPPADEFFRRGQLDLIRRPHGVAWLARGMAVDFDLPGHDGALGFLAAVAQAAFNEDLIETRHSNAACGTRKANTHQRPLFRAPRSGYVLPSAMRRWVSR